MDTPNINLKSTDKLVAGALAAAVALGGGYALYRALPFLIELATNTTYFLVMGAVAVVLAIFLLDPNTWRTVLLWEAIQVAKVRKRVIGENPVAILDLVISRLTGKAEELRVNIEQARGSTERLKAKRVDFAAKAQNEENLMKAASRDRNSTPEDVEQHGVAAQRWTKAATDLDPMITLLSNMQDKFQEGLKLCRRSIANASNQKEVLEQTLESLQEGQKATTKFRAFLSNSPELQLQREAVAEIQRQATNAEASIDQFLQDINPILQQDNLQRRADAEQAMAKFGSFTQAALPAGGAIDGQLITASVAEKVKI